MSKLNDEQWKRQGVVRDAIENVRAEVRKLNNGDKEWTLHVPRCVGDSDAVMYSLIRVVQRLESEVLHAEAKQQSWDDEHAELVAITKKQALKIAALIEERETARDERDDLQEANDIRGDKLLENHKRLQQYEECVRRLKDWHREHRFIDDKSPRSARGRKEDIEHCLAPIKESEE